MSGILKITKIKCSNAEGKDKVLAALQNVADHVVANKPEIAQYLVALPLENISGTEIYVVEEMKSHQDLEILNDLHSLLSDTSIVSSGPGVHVGSIATKVTSGRPLPITSDPAILLVGMEYKPGTVSNAVIGWKDMADGAVESVPGVNVFTVMEDTEASMVRTIEVLDSWESLSVLVKTDAAKRNIEHNGKDRTGHKSAIKLRAIAGFVGR